MEKSPQSSSNADDHPRNEEKVEKKPDLQEAKAESSSNPVPGNILVALSRTTRTKKDTDTSKYKKNK